MDKLVSTVNLNATFAQLQKGDTVEIGINDATESNVRAAACRYAKKKKIELKVSVLRGTGKITVVRKS